MRLQSENIDGIKAIVNETNARHFHVVIDGPGGVSLNITKLLHFITWRFKRRLFREFSGSFNASKF